jgi:hypothetical protein
MPGIGRCGIWGMGGGMPCCGMGAPTGEGGIAPPPAGICGMGPPRSAAARARLRIGLKGCGCIGIITSS